MNIRKNFFHCEGDRALAQVTREVVDSPSVEIFKTHLDVVLGKQLWVAPAERGGWTR